MFVGLIAAAMVGLFSHESDFDFCLAALGKGGNLRATLFHQQTNSAKHKSSLLRNCRSSSSKLNERPKLAMKRRLRSRYYLFMLLEDSAALVDGR